MIGGKHPAIRAVIEPRMGVIFPDHRIMAVHKKYVIVKSNMIFLHHYKILETVLQTYWISPPYLSLSILQSFWLNFPATELRGGLLNINYNPIINNIQTASGIIDNNILPAPSTRHAYHIHIHLCLV